ncbi:MAG: ATP-binding protein [Lentimicrobiaceae bacterium]|nr:ATP-binding protein [Lentimicrobiaceae bacterium]
MSKQALKYKFDVSTYRLLGRELITDRITALFELVKNCYDANSTEVTVEFFLVNPRSDKSRIVIKDNGVGMSFEDVRDKWMVIGTSSKRKSLTSPAPFSRKVTGRKGVGRFAVDKLGAKLLLKTKQASDMQTLCLETDWSVYEKEEKRQLTIDFSSEQKLFTDIDNRYWFENSDSSNGQGTVLEITLLNDVWTEHDITRAYKELSKLIMPSFSQVHPFVIHINAPQYSEYHNKKVESLAIAKATLKVELDFDPTEKQQETLDIKNDQLIKARIPEPPSGFLRMTLYYYDKKAKTQFKKTTNEIIDGLKVYRDGIIATPFAEYTADQNAQKDLLGIDKRRYSGFFDKISTRDILGWIDISTERNPDIIDATNRQDFVDNEAWQELKKYVIKQISKIEAYLKIRKDDVRIKAETHFTNAKEDISDLRKELNTIKENPKVPIQVKEKLEQLEKAIQKTQASVNKSYKEYQDLKTEKRQQENLFFSLVSLQTYAGMLSHITRTSLGKIKRKAEYLHKHFPDPRWNNSNEYLLYSAQIYDEMNRLDKAVDFMLKYAKDDQNFEDIDVKQIIENQMLNIYADIFSKEHIKPIVEVNGHLFLYYNQKSFEDIIDNLISNSMKALPVNQEKKIIKCSVIIEKDKFVLYFSDNGRGIEEKDRDKIFDVFFTTTAELGGAGLGLFIIKSRIEALNGKIELVDNELKPTGTTFKIEFPFKES